MFIWRRFFCRYILVQQITCRSTAPAGHPPHLRRRPPSRLTAALLHLSRHFCSPARWICVRSRSVACARHLGRARTLRVSTGTGRGRARRLEPVAWKRRRGGALRWHPSAPVLPVELQPRRGLPRARVSEPSASCNDARRGHDSWALLRPRQEDQSCTQICCTRTTAHTRSSPSPPAPPTASNQGERWEYKTKK